MATPSIARKNQIANGIAAKMPGLAAAEGVLPDQPPLRKFAAEKPGATTPMKTHSSKIAISVTTSSKLAAIVMPAMLSAMNTR